jgi:hypothetical protein
VLARESGKDQGQEIGSQTLNGLSVRAFMTLLTYIKAMAYLRGEPEVSFEDARQIIPFVLHDKLSQNSESTFFDLPEHEELRTDKIAWLRDLFDRSCQNYDALDLDRDDPVKRLASEFEQGLEGLSERDVRKRLASIEKQLNTWARGKKFYAHMYDDVLKLKYLHQRYTNYLKWLQWQT